MESKELKSVLEDRVLVLDGAMGTMIQRLGIGESEYRGERFSSYPGKLSGCNDLLMSIIHITEPKSIKSSSNTKI